MDAIDSELTTRLLPGRDRRVARAEVDRAPKRRRSEHRDDLVRPGMVVAARYLVAEVAGRGGMGIVFRARDLRHERQVALKVAQSQRIRSHDDLVARLVAEARTMSLIDDPSVPRVFDVVETGRAGPAIVLEWVDGSSLDEELRDPTIDRARTLDLAIQVLRAVRAVHRCGFVHGDLKPSNVLIEQEPDAPRVRLVDFGLASPIHGVDANDPSRSGVIIGTPCYMAPEALFESGSTPAADVYSLGVILHEMFLGTRPDPVSERVRDVASFGDAAVDHALAGSTLGALGRVIARCLRWDPAARFADAAEALDALLRTVRSHAASFSLRDSQLA
ncbi:serine/threonine-protein kinase [Sandaracinus amylolyticus]|uniref:Serine/threonine protein kinase n=1 Tax=Sandaracinus amylolyticus TaxID=927083 RepID=A0A0F6W3W6_9BACT|nr:serine/threonine-protein kinase [Sandaracinus amylolyticus]AKF06831.1 Serine/threonine protein kinase [Sandaracinus amylolyticus]